MLKAGVHDESAGAGKNQLSAWPLFAGFGIGVVYRTMMSAFKLWKDTPEKVFGAPLKNGSIAAEISPELLGVGYIIGPRIASIMMAGGVLSYLMLIPMIKFFGASMIGDLPSGPKPVADMSLGDVRNAFLLYIGAGAVAMGGIMSMVRSMPTILHGLQAGLTDFRSAAIA